MDQKSYSQATTVVVKDSDDESTKSYEFNPEEHSEYTLPSTSDDEMRSENSGQFDLIDASASEKEEDAIDVITIDVNYEQEFRNRHVLTSYDADDEYCEFGLIMPQPRQRATSSASSVSSVVSSSFFDRSSVVSSDLCSSENGNPPILLNEDFCDAIKTSFYILNDMLSSKITNTTATLFNQYVDSFGDMFKKNILLKGVGFRGSHDALKLKGVGIRRCIDCKNHRANVIFYCNNMCLCLCVRCADKHTKIGRDIKCPQCDSPFTFAKLIED